jgi:ammonium transporter Rh
MFGAFFGLAVSYMLGKPNCVKKFEGGATADTFSLIGTVFLWIYWPSFNGGGLIPNSPQQQRALINTILALTASTIGSFFTSGYLSGAGKYRPVDIQNATLAGGIAIGAVCHLALRPFAPILIGLSAGCLCTFGYNRILAVMETYGVYDNCGILNLHGMPSLIGGVASIILAAVKAKIGHDMPHPFYHNNQWQDQFAAVAMTLGMAIGTGLLTGFVLYLIRDTTPGTAELEYQDTPYWDVEEFPVDMAEEEAKIRAGLADIEGGVKAAAVLTEIVSRCSAMGLDRSAHSEDAAASERSDHGDNDETAAEAAVEGEEVRAALAAVNVSNYSEA